MSKVKTERVIEIVEKILGTSDRVEVDLNDPQLEEIVERIVDKFLAVPAARFLWMKRSLSLLISDQESGRDKAAEGSIVQGKYQSPILVQWQRPTNDATRRIGVRIVRFV